MSKPIKFSLRFIIFCLFLMLVASQYGEVLIKPLLPLYEWQIGKIADEYRILSFGLDNLGLERVIHLKVTLVKPIYIAGQTLMPDARGVAEASTNIGHIWQMAVVCLAMIMAWPTKHLRAYFVRFAFAIPLLVLISLLDTPLALLASLWNLILSNLAPGSFSPLIAWDNFLEGGGRLAIGIVAGLFSVWFAQIIQKPAI